MRQALQSAQPAPSLAPEHPPAASPELQPAAVRPSRRGPLILYVRILTRMGLAEGQEASENEAFAKRPPLVLSRHTFQKIRINAA